MSKLSIKAIIYISIILSMIGMSTYIYILNEKVKRYGEDIDRYKTNIEVYESRLSVAGENNHALLLTLEDMENSKDSVVQKLNEFRKKNKKGKPTTGDVIGYSDGEINAADTLDIKNDCNFKLDTTFVFNDKTKSHIKIDSTSIVNTLDIKVGARFHIYSDMEFANKRKNWFDRLVHIDYRKKPVIKYKYEYTNDLIDGSDTVIVID